MTKILRREWAWHVGVPVAGLKKKTWRERGRGREKKFFLGLLAKGGNVIGQGQIAVINATSFSRLRMSRV